MDAQKIYLSIYQLVFHKEIDGLLSWDVNSSVLLDLKLNQEQPGLSKICV